MCKKEEIKEVFDKLSDDNKDVLTMVANGMKIAQENAQLEKHIPHIN